MSTVLTLAAAAAIKFGFCAAYYRLHRDAREHHKEGCACACYAALFWLSLAFAGLALAEIAHALHWLPWPMHEAAAAAPGPASAAPPPAVCAEAAG